MRPFFAVGLVVIVGLLSQACLFGGGDDDEPTPTSVTAIDTPTSSGADETATPEEATATPAGDDASATQDPTQPSEYTVKAGDFLSVIAANHGVTVEAIVAANGLENPDQISVGQVLIIPARE